MLDIRLQHDGSTQVVQELVTMQASPGLDGLVPNLALHHLERVTGIEPALSAWEMAR